MQRLIKTAKRWAGRPAAHIWLTEVMPWAVSLLFHASLIVLASVLVWTTIRREDERIIVPIVTLGDTPGTPLTLLEPQVQEAQPSSMRRMSAALSAASVVRDAQMASGVEPAVTSASASGPFGAVADSGDSYSVGFFGAAGNARSIVFIIDASGSMIDIMPPVVQELRRTIHRLNERQRFTVLFCQDRQAFEVPVPQRGLKAATAHNKRQVAAWIDLSAGHINPSGQTNLAEALLLALRYEPDLIYLLSDNVTGQGRYGPSQDQLLRMLREHNARSSTINTIQFYYPDPAVAEGGRATLELIAEQTGGVYKFVDGRQLPR